jgi:hypothetical protein
MHPAVKSTRISPRYWGASKVYDWEKFFKTPVSAKRLCCARTKKYSKSLYPGYCTDSSSETTRGAVNKYVDERTLNALRLKEWKFSTGSHTFSTNQGKREGSVAINLVGTVIKRVWRGAGNNGIACRSEWEKWALYEHALKREGEKKQQGERKIMYSDIKKNWITKEKGKSKEKGSKEE